MPALHNALLLALAAVASAAPAPLIARQEAPIDTISEAWDAGAVTQFPIHSSCNASQAHQIATGLNETIVLAEHAKEHILRWGNESEIYQKYFGDRPPYEAIGAYEIIVNGDKSKVLFRCDNPDGNCALEGWGGHWRGENATYETVICDLSYETRRSLTQMCALGYNVADSPTNTFWASDLMHRLYHIPAIGRDYIGHFADDYHEVLELAGGNNTDSTHDSDTLQYFALEAYAYDIAVAGEGCPGEHGEDDHSSSASAIAAAVATSATAAAAPASTTGSPTVSQAPSTTSLPANCHTHDGGDVHCT
ncbi:Prenylated Rab acceptor protein 1 [Exophiala xenobiotica]|uniref:Prenylated Rab acceptor protein 1 n=1 Tax=Vermiconidia calcicola TaxID=1690605 RepID=A0AAV9QK89_9PEZI|nr:Prenylated Rab acceptor protein 1 [Exophiala xenobiotica]KAK5543627.1 Prenylated Rab acceptor protein 1 [Vermiconidia calcicola]KAK5213467.1 Prenylated Rab acceptor protein 1 [Exophiala xenobiotica]KAK5231142.1 Prenylated Rab acceptor protein 1 [Exophiala xenobiotica]KAK5274194.1 Prenylated Rab acceptor protein 1 [Exophiala xenobiotica]